MPISLCEDLFQLLPVKDSQTYGNTSSIKSSFPLDLQRKFKLAELTEVMGLRDDSNFSDINKICIGNCDDLVEAPLKS